MIDLASLYEGKRVLVTGHTGFKGRWLVEALKKLGAHCAGFSLPDDICNPAAISLVIRRIQPDIVFHLAAQAFVPVGYEKPRETFAVNVDGTANLLEALRVADRPCAVVIVTTDKCYPPSISAPHGAHREIDPLGGRCPYSASKAAAEHLVEAYRASFFAPKNRIAVATARAGNVIGGGDFGIGRLVPNAVRALREGRSIPVFNPDAIRPWQYVEDVIDGYLRLGAALWIDHGRGPSLFASAWNFGPSNHFTVREVCDAVIDAWGSGTWEVVKAVIRETSELRIDSTKARAHLGWLPAWSFTAAINATIKWYREHV